MPTTVKETHVLYPGIHCVLWTSHTRIIAIYASIISQTSKWIVVSFNLIRWSYETVISKCCDLHQVHGANGAVPFPAASVDGNPISRDPTTARKSALGNPIKIPHLESTYLNN
jgi:hypothetical protein